ncbi:hypothetical protein EV356DRAFT_528054 [Viridothelium virens]|uniref:Uncharacterized protein n=1 Tax=Viridothelium virens TaxID=1048519 RepID=A0A6A6HMZ0_VIRVR|nr:hypothetical protein EV356DRAFT_528054 [Viridothelium virens]
MAPISTSGPLTTKDDITNLIKLVVSIFSKVVSTASSVSSSQVLPEPPNGPHLHSRSNQPTKAMPDTVAHVGVVTAIAISGCVVIGIVLYLRFRGIFGICFRVSFRHMSPRRTAFALTATLVRRATGRRTMGINRVLERWQETLAAMRQHIVNDRVHQAIHEIINQAMSRATAGTHSAEGGSQQRRTHCRSRSEPIAGSNPIALAEQRRARDDTYALPQLSLGGSVRSESWLGPGGRVSHEHTAISEVE